MIITKKRDFKELIENVKNYRNFFLIGCSECATLCGTGGEPELKAMKEALEAEGKSVTGTFVAKTGCQVLGTKVELKPFKEAMDKTDCIIVMSCGAGTQTAVELYEDKPVYPANDSLFLGNMTRLKVFDERCSLCGECILDKTGGICPITRCAKSLLNGPCGGSQDGKCEISPDLPCAWELIIKRLSKIGCLHLLEEIMPPKNWEPSYNSGLP
ncbi:MAG: methylenetetrahydrofolate reductase C-terminal domain-containing protein, partial [Thermodesulfovibrionales bacterium]|nr:methylenetetrahydrofolate reductase C-terminal domain-containing protein [Thermodesulfovibrionales bacterium]